jgi:subtilisin family serine protease
VSELAYKVAYLLGYVNSNCYIGIDLTNPEFASNPSGRTVQNVFAPPNADFPYDDVLGHGTHVAGTVGGNTVGVAPHANIIGLNVFDKAGYSTNSMIVAAMDEIARLAAASGRPSVVNLSLGGNI